MTTREIIDLEEAHLLPTYRKLPIALVRGEGPYVWDADGKRYLDFYGGHCVSVLGHCPEPVVAALRDQAAKLMFYSNVAYSDVRAKASRLITALAPEGLGNVFFCNSGSEANETALKLARASTGRAGVIAMDGGFHGRTLGSLAATHGPKYREPYTAVLPDTHFVPFGDAGAVADVLESDSDVAAVILEPIQSMAGVREAEAAYYAELRELCDEHGAMLIFDEVQTGVGRTGTFSIADQLGATPDIITLAKSLGAGVPVGAVLVSDAIARDVRPGDQGSTFGGGMLAMAAVHATLETLSSGNLMERAGALFEQVRDALESQVVAVRGRGCLIGVELDVPAAPVLDKLRAEGILAGSAAPPEVIRLMPPINTPHEAVDAFIERFLAIRHSLPATHTNATPHQLAKS